MRSPNLLLTITAHLAEHLPLEANGVTTIVDLLPAVRERDAADAYGHTAQQCRQWGFRGWEGAAA